MTPERWRRVSRLFEEAGALEPGERASYLEAACPDDPELRAEVLSLFAAETEAPGFLDLRARDLVASSELALPGVAPDDGGPVAPPDLAGRTLGHYDIVELLGAGGMGAVYLATDRKLGRRVALKVLPPELSAHRERRARFQREARIAASLSHPNLVTLYAIEEAEGLHFLTMELVEGRTLGEWIPRGGASLPELLDVGLQLCEALAAAHDREIVHRDLKPGNLMITPEGRVKVLDFGLARLRPEGTDVEQSLSAAPGLRGTIPYMSPEQLTGGPVDSRSDLFSLGVVLYEVATGRRPFPGDSVATLATQILRDSPPSLSLLRPDLPPELREVVRRSLEKDPHARWESAHEMARRLRDLRSTSTTGGTDEHPGPRVGRRASIAVLPLLDLSPPGERDDFFGEGLAAELINALGRVDGLRVAARTSSFRLRERSMDVREMGRQLGVATLLEGTIRRSADRVRITVELVETEAGSQLWSGAFERPLDDLVEIQRETARAIVEQMELGFETPSGAPPRADRPADPEAYRSYLEARHLWNRRTESSVGRSIELFQRTLELEPTFAPAYAGLADAYALLGNLGLLPARNFVGPAKEAASRALALDERLAEAHAALGSIYGGHEWDWERAERELRRAVTLNPSYATARQWLAELLIARGRGEEALAESGRARELDPLSPVTRTTHGWILYLLRRYEEAREQLEATVALDPGFHLARLYLGSTLRMLGAMERALGQIREAIRLSDGAPLPIAVLGEAEAAGGDRAAAGRAEEALRRMATERHVSSYCLALVRLGAGDHDAAIAALEEAYEERSDHLIYMRAEPILDPLRDHPGFRALADRLGL